MKALHALSQSIPQNCSQLTCRWTAVATDFKCLPMVGSYFALSRELSMRAQHSSLSYSIYKSWVLGSSKIPEPFAIWKSFHPKDGSHWFVQLTHEIVYQSYYLIGTLPDWAGECQQFASSASSFSELGNHWNQSRPYYLWW